MLVLLILLIAWLYWLLSPVSEEELPRTDTIVMTETRYIVSADSVDIFAFSTSRGDTLLNDIRALDKPVIAKEQGSASAQWIRKYKILPTK